MVIGEGWGVIKAWVNRSEEGRMGLYIGGISSSTPPHTHPPPLKISEVVGVGSDRGVGVGQYRVFSSGNNGDGGGRGSEKGMVSGEGWGEGLNSPFWWRNL